MQKNTVFLGVTVLCSKLSSVSISSNKRASHKRKSFSWSTLYLFVPAIVCCSSRILHTFFGLSLIRGRCHTGIQLLGMSPTNDSNVTCVTWFLSFFSFYLSKHTGRKISLHSNLGHAELLAVFNGPVIANEEAPAQLEVAAGPLPSSSLRFSASSSSGGAISGLPGSPGVSDSLDNPAAGRLSSNRKYILQVSTFQMVILMLFNQRSRYTFGELLAESGIPERDLMRNLTALCLSKSTQRILCKEPKSKEIEPTDVFSVNNSFFSRHYKIKVSHCP